MMSKGRKKGTGHILVMVEAVVSFLVKIIRVDEWLKYKSRKNCLPFFVAGFHFSASSYNSGTSELQRRRKNG